jgi:hypothetical protein
MKVPLPSTLASAISTMKWPLLPNSVPMYYESLSSLSQLRQNSNGSPFMSTYLQNLDETIESLVLKSSDDNANKNNNNNYNKDNNVNNINEHDEATNKYFIMISLALLCLGHGYSDEAHDLVTPLSWSEETHFGGPSLCAIVNEEVVTLASYVHSLVHRREGFAQGEFGMIGWQNANYWSSATNSRAAAQTLPYANIRNEVLAIGNEFGDEAIQWCKEHIIDEGGNDESYWEPRALHALCARTSRDESSHDNKLRLFAEQAAEAELRLLLHSSLNRAGYLTELDDLDNSRNDEEVSILSMPIINDNISLSIANKVSSAHLAAFQSSNSVTIRNLVREGVDDSFFFSVAAGLACRLLGAPACIYQDPSVRNTAMEGICIMLPKNESEISNHLSSQNPMFYGGGPLSIGDAFASTGFGTGKKGEFVFIPCTPADKKAIFIDKFYGTRGETPTTVIQWSKGTIFETEQ